MEKKPYSVRARHSVYTLISWLGVIVAVVGFFWGAPLKQILPWVGLGVVAVAVVFRVIMVRCPYCGNHLTESKTIPAKCPECHKELN